MSLEASGWAVAERVSGARLRLRRDPAAEGLDLRRRVGTVLGASATAIALALASSQFTGAELVLWPVSGALGVVAILGVRSSVRAWRRLRSGVFLEADAGAGSLTGFPPPQGLADDSRPRTVPFSEVEAVELASFAGGQASVALTVLLRGGERLEGPRLTASGGDPPDAAPLRILAEELGRLCRCPVRTTRREGQG